MKTTLLVAAFICFILPTKIFSQLCVSGSPLSITAGCTGGVSLPATISITPASGTDPGYVTTGSQTFAGNKTFGNKVLLNNGNMTNPSLAYSGNSAQNGWSFTNGAIYTSFDAIYRFYQSTEGTLGITNLPDGSFVPGLTINILHDADSEISPQDGGVNVSTFAGSETHTSTFGGRTANGTYDNILPTVLNQTLVEFIGKGYANGDWEPSNRGVFGVYAANNHDADQQGAYCGIKTTRTTEQATPNAHMSMLIDADGNAGLTYTNTGFNISIPYGWADTEDDRFFSIETSNTSADAGLLIQNGTTTSGGTKGLNIWLDNSAKISYIDNITDDADAYLFFRLKTLATTSSIAAMSITPTGIAMGGNPNIISDPVSALQIDKGNGVASDLRFTIGTSSGITASDGFQIGISTNGDGEIRQRENKELFVYTNNAKRLTFIKSGEIVSGSTENPSYRGQNGVSGSTVISHFMIDPSNSVTSGFAWSFDATNGFVCSQGNGTRRIQGMAIRPLNTTSTANSEAMAMGFFTQSGGSAATEKLRIETDGRIYGTALHNNAGSVTGTTTQYIASGTYTPSLSAQSNLSTSSVTEAQWMRVGNVVTVSGRFTVQPASIAAANFELSLPIASNIANVEDASGVSFSGAVAGQGAEIIGVVANDTIKIQWIAIGTSQDSWSYTYTYEIK